ncbi:hypothetical protein EIP91_001752 [Steccherinum ochraceum]|uniref:Uncharacterized protein n=1 Tax=Steccherinum ochraceum TaxID=92696 RepID=A0A4R0RDA2_9APHY|nr:hypothetical protein EIP91_001752 [Steccherinum ochraceum]
MEYSDSDASAEYQEARVTQSTTRSPNGINLIDPMLPEGSRTCTPDHAQLRRVNSCYAATARLPPEILAIVFCFTAEAFIHDLDHKLHYYCNMTKFAEVSHHWRDVALDTPALWNKIVITKRLSLERTLELLRRSKQASLHVAIAGPLPLLQHFQEVAREFVRAETMHIMVSCRDASHIYACLPASAPRLVLMEWWGMTPSTDTSLFSFFEQCATPSLQKLKLTDVVNLTWGPNIFPHSLTHLHVSNFRVLEPSVLQLAEALNSLHVLEELEFSGLRPSPSPDNDSLPPIASLTVVLPQLRLIKLCGDTITCAHFLAYLDVPPTARIALRFDSECSPPILTLIAPPIRAKLVAASYDGACPIKKVKIYSRMIHFFTAASDSEEIMSIMSGVSWSGHSWRVCWGNLCTTLPLQDVTACYIRNPSYTLAHRRGSWKTMLSALTAVTRLVVSESESTEGVLFLLESRAKDPTTGTMSYLLPKLKEVVLSGVLFREDEFDSTVHCSLAHALAVALRMREAAGCRVDILRLSCCANVTFEDLAILKSFVPLQWDHQDRTVAALRSGARIDDEWFNDPFFEEHPEIDYMAQWDQERLEVDVDDDESSDDDSDDTDDD